MIIQARYQYEALVEHNLHKNFGIFHSLTVSSGVPTLTDAVKDWEKLAWIFFVLSRIDMDADEENFQNLAVLKQLWFECSRFSLFD